jgi:2-(1,2-epoxy-1,2-dihydrophenyl)acetyl-CoA isomerase
MIAPLESVELFVSSAMRVDIVGGVGHLTLTQGARGNPVDDPFCDDLDRAAELLTTDPRVRSILLKAEGSMFSVGGDLKGFQGPQSEWPAGILRKTAKLNAAVLAFQAGDPPLVAAVSGVCAGGMVALVAGCDFVISASNARFVSAYAGIGFSCDVGASVMLPRRMGDARARRFLLLNETLAAPEALVAGLVDEVVELADLASRSDSLAAGLAAGPTCALGQIRRLLSASGERSLANQLSDEGHTLARLVGGGEASEGLTAFIERRPAVFART